MIQTDYRGYDVGTVTPEQWKELIKKGAKQDWKCPACKRERLIPVVYTERTITGGITIAFCSYCGKVFQRINQK